MISRRSTGDYAHAVRLVGGAHAQGVDTGGQVVERPGQGIGRDARAGIGGTPAQGIEQFDVGAAAGFVGRKLDLELAVEGVGVDAQGRRSGRAGAAVASFDDFAAGGLAVGGIDFEAVPDGLVAGGRSVEVAASGGEFFAVHALGLGAFFSQRFKLGQAGAALHAPGQGRGGIELPVEAQAQARFGRQAQA